MSIYLVLINGRIEREFSSLSVARMFAGHLSIDALVQIIDNTDQTCVYNYECGVWSEE